MQNIKRQTAQLAEGGAKEGLALTERHPILCILFFFNVAAVVKKKTLVILESTAMRSVPQHLLTAVPSHGLCCALTK